MSNKRLRKPPLTKRAIDDLYSLCIFAEAEAEGLDDATEKEQKDSIRRGADWIDRFIAAAKSKQEDSPNA